MSTHRRSSSSGVRDDVSEPSSSVTGAAGSHGCPSPTMSSLPQEPACGASLRPGAVLVTAQRVAPGGPTTSSRSAYVSRSSKAAEKQGDATRLLARIQYLEAKLRHQEVESKAALARADLLGDQRGRLLAQVTQLSDNMQGMVRQNERLSSENSRLHNLLHQAHLHSSSAGGLQANMSGPGAGAAAAGVGAPHPGPSSPFCQMPPPPHPTMHHRSGGGPGPWVGPAWMAGPPPHLGRSQSDGLLAMRQQLAAAAAAEAAAEFSQHAAAAAAAGWGTEGPGGPAGMERWLPRPHTPAATPSPALAGGSSGGGGGACGPSGGSGALPPSSYDPSRPLLGPGPPGSNTRGCPRLRFDQRAWSSPALPCHLAGLPFNPGGMPGRPPMDMLPPLGAGKQPVPPVWRDALPHHLPMPPQPLQPPSSAAGAGDMCPARYATRGAGGVMAAGAGLPLPPPAAAASRKRGRSNTLSPEVLPAPPAVGRVRAPAGRQGEGGGGAPGAGGDRRQMLVQGPGGRLVTTTAPAPHTPFAAGAGAGASMGAPNRDPLQQHYHSQGGAAAAAKRLKQEVKSEVAAAPSSTRALSSHQLGGLDNDSCLLLPGGLAACTSPCQRVGSPAVTDSGASGDTAAHRRAAGGSASPSTEQQAQARQLVGEGGGLNPSSQLGMPSLPAYLQGCGLAAAEMGGNDGLMLGLGGLPGMLLGGGAEEGEELLTGAGWDWLNEMVL